MVRGWLPVVCIRGHLSWSRVAGHGVVVSGWSLDCTRSRVRVRRTAVVRRLTHTVDGPVCSGSLAGYGCRPGVW